MDALGELRVVFTLVSHAVSTTEYVSSPLSLSDRLQK